MYWCWLLGHEARGPFYKAFLGDEDFYVYVCDRCEKPIIFSEDEGWLKYEGNLEDYRTI